MSCAVEEEDLIVIPLEEASEEPHSLLENRELNGDMTIQTLIEAEAGASQEVEEALQAEVDVEVPEEVAILEDLSLPSKGKILTMK
jgi:hypothetical protein